MSQPLPPSPTPKNVADAYAVRVSEQAHALAGRDGRLTVHEAGKRPEVYDAHRRTGRSRPVVRTAVEAARAAMLAEARRAAGTDGRVSLADSRRMTPPFAQAFAALREIPREEDEARVVVTELDRLVPGLSFTSESDYGYEPFSVELDPGMSLTLEVLQLILPWNEGPAAEREWEPPAGLRLEVSADDSFWADEAAKDPYYGADFRALDRLMKRSFSEETIRMDGESLTARIFSVTLPEGDAALAPYFVLGRLASGEVVGLRTFRVWT